VVRVLKREDEPAGDAAAAIIAGRLAIDVANRAVTWDGTPLPRLRPREFALITTLAGEPGRVFTKRELEAAVLGFGGLVGSRAIDQHVVNVRAKLPEPTVIRTVRGVGYVFECPAPPA
jgi:DNA-binding response OmpR family regulator